MAAIPQPPRRSTNPPGWAGALGMVLGSTIGAAACYALATVF